MGKVYPYPSNRTPVRGLVPRYHQIALRRRQAVWYLLSQPVAFKPNLLPQFVMLLRQTTGRLIWWFAMYGCFYSAGKEGSHVQLNDRRRNVRQCRAP